MNRKLPSASALDRAMACRSSEVIPHVEEAPNVYGEAGSTLHAFLERIGKEGPDARGAALDAIADDDPGKPLCEAFDVSMVPLGGHHELALAWNPDTDEGRILGEGIDRQYEAHGADRLREYVGSEDFGGILPGGRGLVLDYKSGRPKRARESWQMRGLSVMKAAAAHVDEIIGAHIVVRGSGQPYWDWFEFDALMIASFKEEMRDLAADLRKRPDVTDGRGLRVVEGDHCTYCPAFVRCPAKTALIHEMSVGLAPANATFDSIEVSAIPPLWLELDRYEAMIKRLRGQCEKVAERLGPIQLGNGYELRVAEGEPRDKITDAARAYALIVEHFDEQTARESIGMTKAALGRAAKGWAHRTGLATSSDAEDRIVGLLRREGAMERKSTDAKVREVKTGR